MIYAKLESRVMLLFVSLILIILANENYAQLKAGFSTNQVFDSNPYKSPVAEAEIISSFNGGIEYDFEKINLLYYGSYSLFNKSADRNFYWHQLGIYKSSDNYMFGLYGEQRIDKLYYNYYDYISATGYFKKKIDYALLNPVLSFSASYKNYKNLSDYNNVFISGGVKLNKSFETKTALIFNSSLNYKYYLNTGDLFSSKKKGSAVSSTQLYFNIRAAQSLFENTGIAVYYLNRSLLGESLSLASDYYYSFGDESDLYDDPYSRNENAFGAELTQILPAGIIGKSGYEISYRKYPSQGIYVGADLFETEASRDDIQRSFYLLVSKTIIIDDSTQSNLNLSLNYSFVNKTSNSYWYQYEGSQLSINIGFQF